MGPSNCEDKDKYGRIEIADLSIFLEINFTLECSPLDGMKIAYSLILNRSISPSVKYPITELNQVHIYLRLQGNLNY